MRGNIVANMDTDRADFLIAYPNATRIFCHPLTFDIKAKQQVDDDLFQFPDIFPHPEFVFFEVENGVANELSRTMIGDAAATVGRKDFYSIGRNDYVLFASESPYGENGRMLQ